jgi:3-mercaptopyruvate sulfurtransferase SseA
MANFEEKNAEYKFTIPTLDEFRQTMARLKIGKKDTIICYESSE